MSWIMAAVTIGSSLVGSMGAQSAANTQADGQRLAAKTQWDMFNRINGQEQPFMQTGYGALGALNKGLGLNRVMNPRAPMGSQPPGQPQGQSQPQGQGQGQSGMQTSDGVPNMLQGGTEAMAGGRQGQQGGGQPIDPNATNDPLSPTYRGTQDLRATTMPVQGQGQPGGQPQQGDPMQGGMDPGQSDPNGVQDGQFTRGFSPEDFKSGIDPGYQFRLEQGGQALSNSMTPGSGALSGATLKSLMGFNQGMASQEYGNAFNRFQTQNNNVFARLSGLAGMGQNAASQVGTQGATLGQGIGQAQAGAAASQAGGTVGATNAITGGMMPLGYIMNGNSMGGNMGGPVTYGANPGGIYTPPPARG